MPTITTTATTNNEAPPLSCRRRFAKQSTMTKPSKTSTVEDVGAAFEWFVRGWCAANSLDPITFRDTAEAIGLFERELNRIYPPT
jgi:hypothetical protein